MFTYIHYCRAGDDSTLNPFRFVEQFALALADRYQPFAMAMLTAPQPETVINSPVTVGTAINSEIHGVSINKLVLSDLPIHKVYQRAIRRPLEMLRQAWIPH